MSELVSLARLGIFVPLIKKLKVDEVVFSYSDVKFEYVMTKASIVNAAGVSFKLLGAEETMIKSTKPVIAVGAIRTGCGKSQTSRRIIEILMEKVKALKVNLLQQKKDWLLLNEKFNQSVISAFDRMTTSS